jgi:hypothetical protein
MLSIPRRDDIERRYGKVTRDYEISTVTRSDEANEIKTLAKASISFQKTRQDASVPRRLFIQAQFPEISEKSIPKGLSMVYVAIERV